MSYYNMPCWNGLSYQQQRRLIEVGNLPWGYVPEGHCKNGAELEITTQYDQAPGPRFYCAPCAVLFLSEELPHLKTTCPTCKSDERTKRGYGLPQGHCRDPWHKARSEGERREDLWWQANAP